MTISEQLELVRYKLNHAHQQVNNEATEILGQHNTLDTLAMLERVLRTLAIELDKSTMEVLP